MVGDVAARRGCESGRSAGTLASPALRGATVETVDAHAPQDAGGKPFLDLVDVVSVHFYSGRTPPEIAKGRREQLARL